MALLSDRLMAVAQMVTPGLNVADIGCDHAYLPIYLINEGISPCIIACDVNEGPINIALNNIENAGLEKLVSCRKGDGLTPVKRGEVESVVIAGMGGLLMIRILQDGKEVLEDVKEVILEPQSDADKVRHHLAASGYHIISEAMIKDDNKFYPVIKAIKGSMDYSEEIYYRYGKILLMENNPVLHEYLLKEKSVYKKLLEELTGKASDSAVNRVTEIRKDLELCEQAIECMKTNAEHIEVT